MKCKYDDSWKKKKSLDLYKHLSSASLLAHSVAAHNKHVLLQTSQRKYSLVVLASSHFPLVSQSWIALYHREFQSQKCGEQL